MIALTSNGLTSQALIDALHPITSGLTKAVIVTTASVGYKENDWHIPRLQKELYTLGLSVDYFDFDLQDPRLLLQYDLIEINGGNPFYLLKSMKNSGCGDILKELSQSKILIGISAGSIVLQDSIRLVAQYSPEMNNDVNLSDLSGFSLSHIEILPHYSKFLSRFERFEERVSKYEEEAGRKVIRLDDGQGVIIESNQYRII